MLPPKLTPGLIWLNAIMLAVFLLLLAWVKWSQ